MYFPAKSIVACARITWRDVGIEESQPSYLVQGH